MHLVVQSCEKVDVALGVINGLQAAMSKGWLLLLEGKPQKEVPKSPFFMPIVKFDSVGK